MRLPALDRGPQRRARAPSTCSCPTSSSRLRGRIRTASGASEARTSPLAGSPPYRTTGQPLRPSMRGSGEVLTVPREAAPGKVILGREAALHCAAVRRCPRHRSRPPPIPSTHTCNHRSMDATRLVPKPGSVLWRYGGDAAADRRPAPTRSCSRSRHPTVGAGVSEHSDFRERPLGAAAAHARLPYVDDLRRARAGRRDGPAHPRDAQAHQGRQARRRALPRARARGLRLGPRHPRPLDRARPRAARQADADRRGRALLRRMARARAADRRPRARPAGDLGGVRRLLRARWSPSASSARRRSTKSWNRSGRRPVPTCRSCPRGRGALPASLPRTRSA